MTHNVARPRYFIRSHIYINVVLGFPRKSILRTDARPRPRPVVARRPTDRPNEADVPGLILISRARAVHPPARLSLYVVGILYLRYGTYQNRTRPSREGTE